MPRPQHSHRLSQAHRTLLLLHVTIHLLFGDTKNSPELASRLVGTWTLVWRKHLGGDAAAHTGRSASLSCTHRGMHLNSKDLMWCFLMTEWPSVWLRLKILGSPNGRCNPGSNLAMMSLPQSRLYLCVDFSRGTGDRTKGLTLAIQVFGH